MPQDIAPRTAAWFDMLAAATTPDDVVHLARDYLATWTPEEIGALPRACRPPRTIKFPEQIVEYAFALVKAHLDAGADSNGVTRMATFFAEASWRVAAAMSAADGATAGNDEAF
jgi:hypothetical protein